MTTITAQEKKAKQELASENRDLLIDIQRNAEIKRVHEKLTKKELCNIYGLNYNFYMNCLSGRNFPSKKMDTAMKEYLTTPTQRVYEMVFAFREQETEYHVNLAVTQNKEEKYRKELIESGYLSEPSM